MFVTHNKKNMYSHTIYIRVRYAETDQMGYVYYGNYAAYYESGRTEAIRDLGFTYKELEATGIIMPVAGLEIKYLRPAYYDELLKVVTSLRQLPDTKAQFHTELFNEEGKLLNAGVTTLVFVDAATRQKTMMPEVLRAKLAPYFKAH